MGNGAISQVANVPIEVQSLLGDYHPYHLCNVYQSLKRTVIATFAHWHIGTLTEQVNRRKSFTFALC